MRWLPHFPAVGSDEDGYVRANKPLVAAVYDHSSNATRVCIAQLCLRTAVEGGAPPAPAALSWHGAWDHPHGAITSLSVRAGESGDVCVVVGAAGGAVSGLLLRSPTAPGASADAISEAPGFSGLVTLAAGGAGAQSGAGGGHRGPVADVDLCPATSQVVSVGSDGRILLTSLAAAPPEPVVLADYLGDASFCACRWTSPSTVVTAGSSPGLQACGIWGGE